MKFTLRELRARKNKTQKEIADIVGVTYQTYNAWEKDLTNVAIGKVIILAEYFEVKIDEIKLKG